MIKPLKLSRTDTHLIPLTSSLYFARCQNVERSSVPMFAGSTVKQEAGSWKQNCQLSGATIPWQCWGALSLLQEAALAGTMMETMLVTCCTDMTLATMTGPRYYTTESILFSLSIIFQFTNTCLQYIVKNILCKR